MCIGYLDPCSRGEHDWEEPEDANFKYCKKCGLVQFTEDVSTAEALLAFFQHQLKSLKWRRKDVSRGMTPLQLAILDGEIEMLETYLTKKKT